MTNIFTNPLFGLALSILAYLIGMLIFRRFPHPLTTPLLLATILVILFLSITKIPYKDYYVGGAYLNNLIVPSTVALGIPLYKTFHLMKHHARSIFGFSEYDFHCACSKTFWNGFFSSNFTFSQVCYYSYGCWNCG